MLRRKSQVPPDPKTAQDSALRSLGRREHSAAQLRAKLKARGYDSETAVQAVAGLAGNGLQSDARFAEQLVRSRVSQHYGPLRIEAELRASGLSDADTGAALSASETDWTELARSLHRRRFGTAPVDRAAQQKQYRYLAGRGFSGEHIRAVLRDDGEGD